MASGKDPKQPGKPRGSYHKKWGRNAKKSGQCQIDGKKRDQGQQKGLLLTCNKSSFILRREAKWWVK